MNEFVSVVAIGHYLMEKEQVLHTSGESVEIEFTICAVKYDSWDSRIFVSIVDMLEIFTLSPDQKVVIHRTSSWIPLLTEVAAN